MRSILLSLALLTGAVHAVAPNQMGNDSNDGFQQHNLKLGMGWAMENHTEYRANLLQGAFEYFATDHLAIRGNAGIGLSTAVKNMDYYPFMLGGAIHLFPRYWVDVYLGADAGFVYISAPSLPSTWSTRVTPVAGVTLYFWGAFYLEGEAGYSVLQYARDVAVDMSAPTFRIRTGFYL
jgi:hypothetical protein